MVKFCTSYNLYSQSCTSCNWYNLLVQVTTCTGSLYDQLVQNLNLYRAYILFSASAVSFQNKNNNHCEYSFSNTFYSRRRKYACPPNLPFERENTLSITIILCMQWRCIPIESNTNINIIIGDEDKNKTNYTFIYLRALLGNTCSLKKLCGGCLLHYHHLNYLR